MTTLKSFLEQQEVSYIGEPKAVVFTVGRFNPPTKGHKKLIDTVLSLAESAGADSMIIPTKTVDRPLKKTGKPNPLASKNPLPFEIKVAFMRELFPDVNITEDAPSNPWDIPEWLAEAGYTDIKMVVGSDQIDDFTRLVESSAPHFNSFEIVNAGVRNPDASDITGMSATKAREAARLHDIGKFRAATGWSGFVAERLMEATRVSMGA